ncbi:hypothetical protein DEU56DRAFT_838337 [Suillus clintonianus]|uniref:uncharacterized protein n=1 Tax=Suillus clintonianus TaxID=1904413 RepID=UPI001B883D38|nr:uncharacterized protein DEU56DRAFT_838337 [Suillus clintonianus]KAG2118367.1 hypothetical protein DEU56DRAFT_838337 [Suillus clintonianus]
MTIQELAEGRIDFKGQKTSDDIVRVILIASTFLSFVIGFAFSSLMMTMSTFALCNVALCLVSLFHETLMYLADSDIYYRLSCLLGPCSIGIQ